MKRRYSSGWTLSCFSPVSSEILQKLLTIFIIANTVIAMLNVILVNFFGKKTDA